MIRLSFYADYYRVSVILNNLISNAIKYHDQNKENPFLHIDVSVAEERVLMKFEDNGIGIDKQLLPKIFNMFFRATTAKDGSGLGLYIVKEAVEKLQAKIEIQSELGVGTSFLLRIPNYTNTDDRLSVQI